MADFGGGRWRAGCFPSPQEVLPPADIAYEKWSLPGLRGQHRGFPSPPVMLGCSGHTWPGWQTLSISEQVRGAGSCRSRPHSTRDVKGCSQKPCFLGSCRVTHAGRATCD